jgi:serine/threonine-protein kinase HipA
MLGDDARPVGVLRHDAQGARENASFEYDGAWLAARDSFAIAPSLPLVAGPHFHRRTRDGSVFHAPFADTEPDGWGKRVMLRDRAKRRAAQKRVGGRGPAALLNALDFLLAIDDFSRVGALRFQDESGAFQRPTEPGRRSAAPLLELGQLLGATRAVETDTETAADLAYLRGRGTSLGGMRPKCTVVDDDGHLSIGKFPSVSDERAVTKGEVLAMRLARSAGIDAAEARVVMSEGVPVALIRRFDRGAAGGRLLFVSAATMLGVEATEAGPQTYTAIVDAIRRLGDEVQRDLEELWRRIAFSILINNVDDHLMNHGFLHVAGGRWRLSPAFDLNPFPDRVRELKTWISEDTGAESSPEALLSVAPYFRIPLKRAKGMLESTRKAVAGWRATGKAVGMTRKELDQFAEAFEPGA